MVRDRPREEYCVERDHTDRARAQVGDLLAGAKDMTLMYGPVRCYLVGLLCFMLPFKVQA